MFSCLELSSLHGPVSFALVDVPESKDEEQHSTDDPAKDSPKNHWDPRRALAVVGRRYERNDDLCIVQALWNRVPMRVPSLDSLDR